MDERAVIASAQKGDVQAFNRLVFEYQSIAYNIAYRILGDGDGAADARGQAGDDGVLALEAEGRTHRFLLLGVESG